MRSTLCVFLLLATVPTINAQSSNRAGDLEVDNFAVNEGRTIDVLRALALQTHVVIGISGELIGSDKTSISIDVHRTSLRNLLDSICLKDPRYKWQETKDGNVSVSVGKNRLELLDVVVETIKIGPINSSDLMMLISRQTQVKKWTDHAECHIMQVFTGSINDAWRLDISATNEPLWKILNDVSAQNGTYFWSALRFSSDPCSINLNP